jgi:hypothetical protein
MTRTAVTLVALVFVCAMWFGTIYVLLDQGVDLISVIGVLVVALLSFGIFGALGEPSDRRRRR